MKIDDGDHGNGERHVLSFSVLAFVVDNLNAQENVMTSARPSAYLFPCQGCPIKTCGEQRTSGQLLQSSPSLTSAVYGYIRLYR